MFAGSLLLTSAMLHALWNAIAKSDREPRIALMAILLASCASSLLTLTFWGHGFLPQTDTVFWNLGAGAFEGAYMIALAKSLEDAPLGIAYVIMRGGAMLIVWLISSFFLGEKLTFSVEVGALFILAGLIVTSLEPRQKNLQLKLKWPYICAFFIAGYHVCYGQALARHAEPLSLFTTSMFISVPVFLIFCGREAVGKMKINFRVRPLSLTLGGCICTASFVIFLTGLKDSGAGYAITLRNTSIVFAQIFALAIGEKPSPKQWLGSALVVTGAIFLTLFTGTF